MEDLDVFFVEDWVDGSPTLDLFDSESIIPLDEYSIKTEEKQSNDITASNEKQTQEITSQRKRKRSSTTRRTEINSKPEIKKDDPRRFLINEVLAAYNSSDVNTIWRFLSTYTTEDVILRMIASGDVSQLMPALRKTPIVKGQEQVCEYWYAHTVAIPDDVMVAHETKLYLRSDGTSTIMSNVSVSGSTVLKNEVIDHVLENTLQNSLIDVDNKSKTTIESDDVVSNDDADVIDDTVVRVLNRIDNAMQEIFNHFHNKTQIKTSEDENPLTIHTNNSQWMVSPDDIKINERRINVLMTLHLNNEKKIEMIDYLFSIGDQQQRQQEQQQQQQQKSKQKDQQKTKKKNLLQ